MSAAKATTSAACRISGGPFDGKVKAGQTGPPEECFRGDTLREKPANRVSNSQVAPFDW